MTPELERQLCADFPATFRALAKRTAFTLEETLAQRDQIRSMELVEAFGVEHGDGWYGILRALAENIEPWCEATGVHATQIKEKYGTLSFYVSGGPESDASPITHEEAYSFIDAAERESERICEQCGAPGTERDHSGWLSTRCDPCDDPAKRLLNSVENIENLLRYVIKPKSPEEATKWRSALHRLGEP